MLAIFLLYYFLASHTPMFADDYSFSFDKHDNLLQTVWEKYFTWGGRLLGHAWMLSVQHIAPPIFGIISAATTCFLLASIHLLTYGSRWKANTTLWQCVFPFAIFWFCLPEAWEILLWRTGTLYLLAISCACFFLIPYRFYMDLGVWLPGWMALPFVLFAFLVPFWVEVVVLPSLFLSVYMLYHRRDQTDTPVGAVVALLVFALGAALSLGAPGNFARASVANAFQLGTFISNAVTLTYKYFYTVSIPLLVSIFAILAFSKKYSKINSFPAAIVLAFIVASALSASIIWGGGSASYRALSMAFVLALITANISFGAAITLWPGGNFLPNLPRLSRKSSQSFSTERALRSASTPKWLWKTTQQCFMQSCTREVEQKVA